MATADATNVDEAAPTRSGTLIVQSSETKIALKTVARQAPHEMKATPINFFRVAVII
jgi:hypothetical protein